MIFINFFSKFLSYLEGKVSMSTTSSEIPSLIIGMFVRKFNVEEVNIE